MNAHAIMKPAFLTVALLVLLRSALRAADATTPGEITTPFPTITNLAVEWVIAGDDNLDATCAVMFRAAGDSAWRVGMPLRRA